MPRLIAITGAAGFIGRNLVAALNQRGQDDLLLVDHLGTDEKWKNLRGLAFEDLLSPKEFLTRAEMGELPPLEAILHMGACSSTTERDADFLLENNYRYTRRLCEWSIAYKVRFIYASSAATYGDGSRGYSDNDDLAPSLVPLNMYGYSKHMFDLWAMRRGLLKNIVGLKYFNVYGPYEDHKGDMRSVVQKAFHQIRTTGEVTLFKSYRPDYADGQQKRDFVYVRDVVDVTLSFLERRDVNGLFNCGTGQARTWNDLASAVFSAMGRQPNIRYIEMPESLRLKYQYFTQADMAKLRAAGYAKPFTTLEAGVKDYVQEYLVRQPPM